MCPMYSWITKYHFHEKLNMMYEAKTFTYLGLRTFTRRDLCIKITWQACERLSLNCAARNCLYLDTVTVLKTFLSTLQMFCNSFSYFIQVSAQALFGCFIYVCSWTPCLSLFIIMHSLYICSYIPKWRIQKLMVKSYECLHGRSALTFNSQCKKTYSITVNPWPLHKANNLCQWSKRIQWYKILQRANYS